LALGHPVTLFNRGQSHPHLYPKSQYPHLDQLRGDRDGGLEALRGRTWDAVVDTCGYVPRLVSDAARRLADAVDHYTLISSLSVYDDFTEAGIRETAAVRTLDDETVEDVTSEVIGRPVRNVRPRPGQYRFSVAGWRSALVACCRGARAARRSARRWILRFAAEPNL
jgi:hypothetical protein